MRRRLLAKEKVLILGTCILSSPSQSGARDWRKEGSEFRGRGAYYSGRGGVLQEKDRKRAGKERRLGETEVTAHWHKVSFRGDKNVPKLDCG